MSVALVTFSRPGAIPGHSPRVADGCPVRGATSTSLPGRPIANTSPSSTCATTAPCPAALHGLDVPDNRIHTESYGATEPPDDSVDGVAATASVRLNGAGLAVPISAGQTVLDAVRVAGANPPYSCESGVCRACRAQLRNGKVHLRARMALTDADIERRIILTCQTLPTTPRLAVEYD